MNSMNTLYYPISTNSKLLHRQNVNIIKIPHAVHNPPGLAVNRVSNRSVLFSIANACFNYRDASDNAKRNYWLFRPLSNNLALVGKKIKYSYIYFSSI